MPGALASVKGKPAHGPFSVNTTVVGSVTSIDVICAATALYGPVDLATNRSMLAFTAAPSSTSPLPNVTSGRSVSVHVWKVSSGSSDSATRGMNSPVSVSNAISES